LIVPGAAAPPPAPAAASRPSMNKGKGSAFPGAGKGKNQKKGMSVQKGILMVAIVVVVGVAGFFGFKELLKLQGSMNAADARERSLSGGGGQVAGIAELNDFLDKTDPNNFSRVGAPSSVRDDDLDEIRDRMRSGLSRMSAVEMPTNDLPILPPVYTLDVAAAKILDSKANGKISSTNFVVETARLDPGATSQALRLRQGNPASPDVEVILFLKLKPGESPAGKTITVSKDDKSKEVASVTKLWKPNPKFAAKRKDFFSGYALKLELAAVSEGVLRAKLYLALPDPEQSVVGGMFYAEAPAVTEAAVPTATTAPATTSQPISKGGLQPPR
jgi:hypothetical protein